jgi:ATP-dependent DNA ligase
MFYAFDVLLHQGRDLMRRPLSERRDTLTSMVQPGANVGLSQVSHGRAADMLHFVKANGLEVLWRRRQIVSISPG